MAGEVGVQMESLASGGAHVHRLCTCMCPIIFSQVGTTCYSVVKCGETNLKFH